MNLSVLASAILAIITTIVIGSSVPDSVTGGGPVGIAPSSVTGGGPVGGGSP
jgi:hypothetical protein